ncbi:MAG: ATP-binding protein [Pseudomonadales bacterium]|nr:ATP-binding protein [Pseudomonadales bacterium]
MQPTQHIFRVRRQYNQWVGNQTLEDYALRFTAKKARRWSIAHVGQTALGATAFLALEAISASVTLNYGFANALIAMLTVAAVIFITGFPITYYAARHGLDIDLLTRGAGFGYLGSTITSLIYASFTFIFFAIEAAILASALQALLGIPPAIGYVLCALAVVPIVTHGITAISKFQIGTQSLWLLLQCTALLVVAWYEFSRIDDWTHFTAGHPQSGSSFNLVLFGSAASVLFAMVAQIGEQVDYLRFMPPKTRENRRRWWFWLVLAGPGWIFIGLIKMLLGSFLAYLAFSRGVSLEQAVDPTYMYQSIFNMLIHSPTFSLVLAGLMVIISQMKINITNAYAGSIAWSNFFSRLTHSHPGRVVWLVFNVTIALILMELGIYRALEAILGIFAIVAVSWLGSLSADLMINKPLGLSPSYVEFKRAHLYDINPVGVVSMLLASTIGILCYLGVFGEAPRYLSHFISLGLCFLTVPAVAVLTRSRFYLARQSPEIDTLIALSTVTDNGQNRGSESPAQQREPASLPCCICETAFEAEDMSYCPAYQGAICSLCCSLDSRCLDSCKPRVRFSEQCRTLLTPRFSALVIRLFDSRLGRFLALLISANLVIAVLLTLVNFQMRPQTPGEELLLGQTLTTLFFILLIISGVISWLFLLAHESRLVAQQESNRQTLRLMREIEAHKETDQALQKAKELAEHANNAKSRYLSGISHELRTPLQSVLGYAQLLAQKPDMPVQHHRALQIIKRSGEYLTDLIEGLLDISKIEAGRLDIYRNQVKLPELLEQLVSMFQEQAREKAIGFACHLHNRLPRVVITDEKRLRQILINLLSNAIKYTEKGRVDFHVRYRNQVAEFSVTDTGIGIHDKDIHRILDPFERVRNPDVPNVPGTGLGLTIVRLLTEVMGGELKISSSPGKGSCFSVSLLFSWVDRPQEDGLPSRVIRGYRGARRTLVLVDDEPVHRGLLADLLNPLGFTTLEAGNANGCLDMLAGAAPDLLLLDVSMPGMNGLELAEEIRARGCRAPIIMISADAHERHSKPRDGACHNDYLVKPINTQKLLDCLAHWLKLEWTYDGDKSGSAESSLPAHSMSLGQMLPGHALLRELRAYARIGHPQGVRKTLDDIEKASLVNADTLKFFRKLSSDMRFDQLASNLEDQC